MNIGFIGCGNMAQAMIEGLVGAQVVRANQVIAYDIEYSKVTHLQQKCGILIAKHEQEVTQSCDVLVLAIKPQYYDQVLTSVYPHIRNQIVVSIAPNYTLQQLQNLCPDKTKIIRCMPNTPSQVLAGMCGMCKNDIVEREELQQVQQLFSSFSVCEIVEESQMEAVIAVSGSAPAYVFMMIEAMADGAVKQGLSREQAYTFATQAILGSAQMAMYTKLHPAQLKDMVCSPGGTTIEAVQVLEETGFRASLMQAMQACANKAKNM